MPLQRLRHRPSRWHAQELALAGVVEGGRRQALRLAEPSVPVRRLLRLHMLRRQVVVRWWRRRFVVVRRRRGNVHLRVERVDGCRGTGVPSAWW